MFQAAVKLAMGFTRSVVISARYDSGEVQCSIGTFVVLNNDGWILTCKHILDIMRQASTDAQESAEKAGREAAIHSDPHLTPSQRRKQLGLLRLNRRLITNHSSLVFAHSMAARERLW